MASDLAARGRPFGPGSAPADYERAVAHQPIATGIRDGRVWLHRFEVPRFGVRLDGASVHRITLHLVGPVLIERILEDRRERRWSKEGRLNLVPAGIPVTRSFAGQADFAVLYLDPTLVEKAATEALRGDPSRLELRETFAEQDETLERLMRLLIAETGAIGNAGRLFVDTLLLAMAVHLVRIHVGDPQLMRLTPGALVGWRLRRAIDLMQAHPDEDISLARLAEAVELSPSHFARAFRLATGAPPHRYLLRLRIMRARHLLEHTRMPVIEVALACGFGQPGHFATTFRNATGLGPRDYRSIRMS